MEGSVETRPRRGARPMGLGGAHQQHQRGRGRQHNQQPAAALSHHAYAGTGAQLPAGAPRNFVYQSLQGIATAAHLKPPRRSWASAPRPVYYQQIPHHQIVQQQQQQLQLHLPLPPPSSSFPHLLASHYHRLYGPHIHNYNVNYFHSNLIAASAAPMSSPTSPRSPTSQGGAVMGPWERKVFEYCKDMSIPLPTYELMSDRRGGRTAWSCHAKIPHSACLPFSARYWYAGTDNAKEDVAEVVYKMFTEPPPPQTPGATNNVATSRAGSISASVCTPPTSPNSRSPRHSVYTTSSNNYTHTPPHHNHHNPHNPGYSQQQQQHSGGYGGHGHSHSHSHSSGQESRHASYSSQPGKTYVNPYGH